MTGVINLAQKFQKFSEHWSPKVVAEMNNYQLKLVKFQGDFVWHNHPDTDEVFLVLKGKMEIEFKDKTVTVSAGELYVIPKGVEHCTRADEECQAMLIEPRGVVNTGEVNSGLTAANDVWI
ncbi:MAG: cupin domain-containing protein [Phormidesmis sp.]